MRVPIRYRLTAVYSVVFLVVIVLMAIGTYTSVRVAMHTMVDRELDTRLAGVDDHLTRHVGRVAWPALAASLGEHPAFQPALLRIAEVAGVLRFEGGVIRDASGLVYREVPLHETRTYKGESFRVLTVRRSILGRSYDLALGTDLSVPGAILERLWLVLLLSIPAVLFVASWAGYWVSGHALAPVSAIIAAARSIDSTKLSQRIAVPDTGDEIQQLAVTTNGMLERIEDGFRHIRRFTDDASHELRTPIAIIRAAAEVALLNRSASENSRREALQRILREAEQSSRLLDDLLYLARADSGTDRVRQEPVDLEASVAQACARVMPLAESKGVAVTFPRQWSPRYVVGDEDQLRRLWLILLDNGLKYTPAGGRVEIAIGMLADGRPFCEVTDTGVGIEPAHLPRLFERFYRAEKARTRSQRGTGLGLAIASEIANLHDAVIDVESEPTKGATFRVTFPRRDIVVLAATG